ncbi:outer membrane protein [Legionella impletisoli]|uniref:Opacity protein-like surface antigen n=1 Tax=Legionella impletisoli TaxID=343510 RepID=A0A917N821_9GAMM|nr:porin family protein [Legionella impletisoli]GGI76532.1 hypothetical protein GCM10007966_01640 [Legionella impletisoli]
MLTKLITTLALTAPFSLYAGAMGTEVSDKSWFGAVGTGYTWPLKPSIDTPEALPGDSMSQGYDGSLSDSGFYSFAIGKQIHRYFDISLNYINNETFDYQKYLSSTSLSNAGHRYFSLNNRAVLLNAFIHPTDHYFTVTNVSLTPFVGAGIGYARNNLSDFYSAQTVQIGDSALGSITSIGPDMNKNAFAWQGSLGLNINPALDHLSFDIGYRYYDGGKFDGPSAIYTNNAGYQDSSAWSGHLKANQLFVNFKYTA